MIALLKKEFNAFFGSTIGYFVIGLFLLLNGLLLWAFKGDFNILDNGFSDLSPFFFLAPFILLFLIPAVTMRSFSEDIKQGTLELLLTQPLTKTTIVLGKFLGSLLLVIIALIPTILYAYTVYQLGSPVGNLDIGSTIGSYLGLLFLATTYTAIGVFSSTLSNNQIVSFLIAILICFIFYLGFEGIYDLTSLSLFEELNMNAHYKSISRGVIDTRDLVYFILVTVTFIGLTTLRLKQIQGFKLNIKPIVITAASILALWFVSYNVHNRFDLTKDGRYTLSQSSLDILDDSQSPITVDVFLEGDNFPAEFKRLKNETKQLLEEFSAHNRNVQFNFINPLADKAQQNATIKALVNRGLTPRQLNVNDGNGSTSQVIIFPWALASYNNITVKIPLVKNKLGANEQEVVTNSVQHLEYAFSNGFNQLINGKSKRIAILKGNNQLPNKNIADIIKSLKPNYYIAPFTLDSVATNPIKTLNSINEYDLIISAKPTEAFTEEEKLVLDQYTMNGGKSLWLIDQVAMEKDSLYRNNGKAIAIPRELNLTDFFFKYGARINPTLVSDLYSAKITLATGAGSQARFTQLPWFYSPLTSAKIKHPIVNNLNYVKFDFASPIDTIKTKGIKKTVLLQSSLLSRIEGLPKEINLETATQEPDPTQYSKKDLPLALLLEGEFTSVYNNRISPFKYNKRLNKSKPTKMVIIADGDIIKNTVSRKGPDELGFDKWTGETYGNKEFLLNTVNYLLDENGLINIRSKDVSIAFLDSKKINAEKGLWQTLNILLPLGLLTLFGILFNLYRKKKYSA